MRSIFVLTTVAIAVAILMAPEANALTDQGVARSTTAAAQRIHSLRSQIVGHRLLTWRYQDRAGVPHTLAAHAERHTWSVAYLRWMNRLWRGRARHAKHLAIHHARAVGAVTHLALWECIHRGEGAWNAATGNGFYGGLQMTSGWGGVARPDLLSPMAQMALADRQYRASGYSRSWLEGQWPNTSPPCLGYA